MSRVLSDDRVLEIIKNVALQYAKDIYHPQGWDSYKFDEYRQELSIKAYEVLHSNPSVNDKFMYKVLYNYATDISRSLKSVNSKVFIQDPEIINYEYGEGVSSGKYDYQEGADSNVDEVIEMILAKVQHDPTLLKYTKAKLILAGEVEQSRFPEIDCSLFYDNPEVYNNSVNYFVLEVILGYSTGRTGGPGSFKSKKSSVFEDIIYDLGVDDQYSKWYEITYTTECDEVIIESYKAMTSRDALELFETKNTKLKRKVRDVLITLS